MVADEDSDQILAKQYYQNGNHQNIKIRTAIIGLSKRVNDYQLSIIDSIDYCLTECLLNVACLT